jgi:hypothetical protein
MYTTLHSGRRKRAGPPSGADTGIGLRQRVGGTIPADTAEPFTAPTRCGGRTRSFAAVIHTPRPPSETNARTVILGLDQVSDR